MSGTRDSPIVIIDSGDADSLGSGFYSAFSNLSIHSDSDDSDISNKQRPLFIDLTKDDNPNSNPNGSPTPFNSQASYSDSESDDFYTDYSSITFESSGSFSIGPDNSEYDPGENYVVRTEKSITDDPQLTDIHKEAEQLISDTVRDLKTVEKPYPRINRKRLLDLVFEAYDRRCVVSGVEGATIETAHIHPHSKCEIYEINSLYNVIPLDAGLHRSFDSHEWSINPYDHKVEVRFDCVGPNYPISKYEGQKIELFDGDASKSYLIKRYDEFLQKVLHTHVNDS